VGFTDCCITADIVSRTNSEGPIGVPVIVKPIGKGTFVSSTSPYSASESGVEMEQAPHLSFTERPHMVKARYFQR
jgi:hypothetical protein